MPISAKIICDSVSPQNKRLTSVQVRLPWVISPELLRHRVFSFSSASGRAIPVSRMIQDVLRDPYIPIHWGKNEPGMQAWEEHDGLITCPDYPIDLTSKEAWLYARDSAVDMARAYAAAGYHKQIVNRLLAPFAHINILITATDWANFFALRRHPDAQPEMRAVADAIWEAMKAREPTHLKSGEWHLPFFEDGSWLSSDVERYSLNDAIKISAARCARLSYFTHDGKPSRLEDDLLLANRLLSSKHMSPFEHQATPDSYYSVEQALESYSAGEQTKNIGWQQPNLHGNLTGWRQFRKTIPDENVHSYVEFQT